MNPEGGTALDFPRLRGFSISVTVSPDKGRERREAGSSRAIGALMAEGGGTEHKRETQTAREQRA